MAIKIKGALAERIQRLLGGQNPTERRIDTLLGELEQARELIGTPEPIVAEPPSLDEPRTDVPPDKASVVAPLAVAAPQMPQAGMAWEEERKLLYDAIANLEGRITEMQKAPTEQEYKTAMATGQLPPPGRAASPLGPPQEQLGPKVFLKLCACGRCTPFRRYHWYCCICRSGPHHYQQRYPHFTKNWLKPGGISGVAHHACSEPCRMQYLALIGVAPGVNDFEPPSAPVTEGEAPGHPAVAFDSE